MIPKFYECMKPMLEFLKDGKVHTMKEVGEHLEKHFGLTKEEREELLPSGKQTVFENRVGWAKTYLHKARLVDVPERGSVKITERGFDVLNENPAQIDPKYLMKFSEFVEFRTLKRETVDYKIDNEEKTPDEIITENLEKINANLKSELFNRIINSSPLFFERLVLDLILKMGYGGSFEEASKILGKSGDEGLDGLIKEDVLGLDNVYLQAKRWKEGTVGRPVVQQFVGALHGKGAKKGIFITTSTFTKDAIDFVESLKDIKVVIIDKEKLLDYMIKYDVGVETKEAIKIKKIDEDYFGET